MNPQKKPYFSTSHFHPSMEPDLFCPRYRMADRPDLYMWDSMEGTPGSASSDVHHMENNTDHGNHESTWQSHLKAWPINRPPLAHTGPTGSHGSALFPSHSQPSTPAPSRIHHDNHPGNPMGGGSGGLPGTPTPTSVSTATSPLVVPQPMKARTLKTYHCRMCDQEFHNKSDMTRHSKDIHGMEEKGHKCPKCFKSFPTSQQLTQHSLVHTNIRKFQCQYCDKTFKQLSHVQQHQRIHTGERPYKCTSESCGKAFAQLANLQQHLKNHDVRANSADKKPYSCTTCDRRFATEASLNHHVTKVCCLHSSLARPHDLICQVCEKHCADEERFFKHIHKYHPEYWRVFSGGRPLSDFIGQHEPRRREKPFHCMICHKRYSHETGYLKHMASHPESDPSLRHQLWACPICQKVFTKESYLLRHMEMKLDDEHSAELVILKKKLKIGTEKPIPHTSATLSSALMTIRRNLGEGTSRDYQLQPNPLGVSRVMPGQRSSPHDGSGINMMSEDDLYNEDDDDNKSLVMDLPDNSSDLKFREEELRSPLPRALAASDFPDSCHAAKTSPAFSNSSSPTTPHHLPPNKVANIHQRPMSRSGDIFGSVHNSDDASFHHALDPSLPKDMSLREAARNLSIDNEVGGSLRRSNSDSVCQVATENYVQQENVDFARPPSHAPSFPRSPDSTYSPTSGYLPSHQMGSGNFRPNMHHYLPSSLHSAPYSGSPMSMPNPYISPAPEMSDRDIAQALQHLARSAASSVYSNR